MFEFTAEAETNPMMMRFGSCPMKMLSSILLCMSALKIIKRNLMKCKSKALEIRNHSDAYPIKKLF